MIRRIPAGRHLRPLATRPGEKSGLAPWLAGLVLVLAACGADEAAPHLTSAGTSIVAFGDSITAGSGARSEETYPERLAGELGVPVVNAGVPGDTTANALERIHGVLSHDPWLVIVELGGNDLLRRRPAADAERDLAEILRSIQAHGAAIVLVEVEPPLFGGDYDGLHRRLADRFDVPLVAGVVGEVLSDPGRKSDQIHPNAAGYADIARAVGRVVEPLVEERREAGLPLAPRDAAPGGPPVEETPAREAA